MISIRTVAVTDKHARDLKRAGVYVKKVAGKRFVFNLAPKWAADVLFACNSRRYRRRAVALLRIAQTDADMRDALEAAVTAGVVQQFVRQQSAAQQELTTWPPQAWLED